MKTTLITMLLGAAIFAGPVLAEEGGVSPAEARLREQLKTVMLQLRDTQGQLVAAQTQQASDAAEKDGKIAELTTRSEAQGKQLEALARQSTEERENAEKTIETLNAGIAKQAAQITRMNETLGKWKVAYEQVVGVAKEKEAARADLEMKGAQLQLTLEERERQNLALFKLGNELLDRYEKFGLGEALTAREPFIGTTRVKFQTLVQDYKDKLDDQVAVASKTALPEVPAGSSQTAQKP